MNKKGVGVITLIVVVAIALVIGIGVGPKVVGQSPPSFGSLFINAHACSADGTCEINDAEVKGGLLVGENDVSLGITPADKSVLDIGFAGDGDSENFTTSITTRADNFNIWGDLSLYGKFNVECDSFPREGSESGEETCLNNGYVYCLFAEYKEKKTYLDSTNGSCSGEIQAEFVRPFINECPGPGGGGGAGCAVNGNGVEPFLGDFHISSGSSDIDVICCRGI